MVEPDLLLDRFSSNAAKQPDKVAFTFLSPGPDAGKVSQTYTYSELEKRTTSLAYELQKSGMKAGERAVLVYPPSLDFILAFLACLKVGAVAVPVFPPNPMRRDTLNMFSKIAESCDAKFALTSSEYNHIKKIAGIRDALTRFKKPSSAWPNLKWIVTDDKATSHDRTLKDVVKCKGEDIAFLQYTSGSTSDPKGVMISHANLGHNLTIITNELKAIEDTIVVSWLPQYHDMGLIGSYLGALYCGGSGYYMSPLSFVQRPMLWIEAVSKYRATHLQAPNFAFKLTARKFNPGTYTNKPLKLSSVRHIINAAEPIDEDGMKQFYKIFGPFGLEKVIFPTYGLAEHTVFVCSGGRQILTVSKPSLEVEGEVVLVKDSEAKGSDDTVSKLVGCGFPDAQGVDVRIVDRETTEELASGKVGEIWIYSRSKALGYYGKKTETAEDFNARLDGIDATFLRTGDLGFFHQKELFICGRLKDLIIVGGRNYFPQDIEATAEESSQSFRPGCAAAFTVDPTREGGEEVAIILELREVPPTNEAKSICNSLADKVRGVINQEHSLSVSQVVLLQPKTVPKTSSGKIARAWCRKAFIQNTLKVVHRKNFSDGAASGTSNGQEAEPTPHVVLDKEGIAAIRALSKKEILSRLKTDISKLTSLPPDSIDKNAALVTILDSLSLSQFKGGLEASYGVKISDEYLFQESTTLNKLVEVVRVGHDENDANGALTSNGGNPSSADQVTAGGVAGALGCPPGVVCCVIQ